MKVTFDTRHDSLEEALATVRAAFGSSGTSANEGGPTAKRGQSIRGAAGTPSGNRSPTGRATTARKASGRTGPKPTAPANPSSNTAPPGQADAIRAWAKAQGMQVKQAGRLPAAVLKAYRESASHN